MVSTQNGKKSLGLIPERLPALALLLVLSLCFFSCLPSKQAGKASERKRIVVTYSILGSVVSELAGTDADVVVLIPNGLDVHEWEPSARDVETLMNADLIIQNGLGLESGMDKALSRARDGGRRIFTASDHIKVRHVGVGEGLPSNDPDQEAGAADPHLWTDPLAMKAVADALAVELKADLGLDVSARGQKLDGELTALDGEVRVMTASLPPERRCIVTGHESLGYFAQAYGFKLVGALVPSLSSEAEASASWLVTLKGLIAANKVPVIFTEVGTPRQVVEALASETGVRALPLATHLLPESGGYVAFERQLATTIVEGLR